MTSLFATATPSGQERNPPYVAEARCGGANVRGGRRSYILQLTEGFQDRRQAVNGAAAEGNGVAAEESGVAGSDFRSTEPLTGSLLKPFTIRGALTCPGDYAVGPDKHGTQSEVVSRRTGYIPHPALPTHR